MLVLQNVLIAGRRTPKKKIYYHTKIIQIVQLLFPSKDLEVDSIIYYNPPHSLDNELCLLYRSGDIDVTMPGWQGRAIDDGTELKISSKGFSPSATSTSTVGLSPA